MIVRDARPDDAPQIVTLLRYLGHPIDAQEVVENLARLAQLGETPLVAVDGPDIIGLVGFHSTITVHRVTAVGRITVLVVSEAAHGRGVGRVLVESVEERLRGSGCKLIEVTSNNKRSDAHRFYEHLGYEKTSSRFMKRL